MRQLRQRWVRKQASSVCRGSEARRTEHWALGQWKEETRKAHGFLAEVRGALCGVGC